VSIDSSASVATLATLHAFVLRGTKRLPSVGSPLVATDILIESTLVTLTACPAVRTQDTL
jgi:hypothetical protein